MRNALVMYRSFYGNTKRVAETIAARLEELGWHSEVRDVRQGVPDLAATNLVFIGAPTRMKRVGWRPLGVIREIARKGFKGKTLAIFDTCGVIPTTPEELAASAEWLIPGAAGIMHKAAVDRGLDVYAETLRCEVHGMKGPLAENALEKARAFAGSVVAAAH
jgi:hypothetical protein